MSVLVLFLVPCLALALFGCLARLVMGPERKPAKIGLFLTAFLLVVVVFLPVPDAWGWAAMIFVAVIIFVVATGASLVEMPASDAGDYLHEKLWGRLKDPNDPASGPKTPPVRIVQLVCVGLVALTMFITWIVRASEAWTIEGDTPRQETSTSAAPTSPSSSAPTSTTPSSTAPSIAWAGSSTPQGCNAPTLNTLSKSVPFKGTDKLQVCRNNQWAAWEGWHPDSVTLTAWGEEKEYGYGRFKVEGTELLIRTTDF